MRKTIQVSTFGASLVLRPTGELDVPFAEEVLESLTKVPSESTVVIDLTALDECHDFALAGLLHDADRLLRERLSTRGISASQANVLSLLGVPKRLIYGQLCVEAMTAAS